jgi:hypothetical protein
VSNPTYVAALRDQPLRRLKEISLFLHNLKILTPRFDQLAFGELVFSHQLSESLTKYAPEVNAEQVIAAGATAFRQVVSAADLPGVITAYAKADNATFYLCAGTSGGIFLGAWGMGWRKIKTEGKIEETRDKQDEEKGSKRGTGV